MDLHFTLVRGPGAETNETPLELTAWAPRNTPGTDLEQELSRAFATRRLTVGGLPLSALVIGQPPLVTGAVIVDGGGRRERERRQSGQDLPAALLLAVHSGPAAGRLLPLRRGSYRIGRTAADLTIPDPDLSRHHARIEVTDTALTIEDLGSANGTEVDGKPVRNATISTDSVIRCGRSTMSIVVAGPPGSRPFCLGNAGAPVAEPLTVPQPAGQENRGMLLLSALLPVVLGVGLALVTGMWMFLAFTAVSAVTLVVPIVSGRRARRRMRSAVAAAAAEDKERRRRSAPSPAQLVLDSPGISAPADITSEVSGVWLRLGLAEQPANVRLEPRDPAFRPPPLGAVPFLLDPGASVVSVRGPEPETSGLMHSFLMQLTGYPLARGTGIAVCGPVDSLPLAARYLPNVTLYGRVEDLPEVLTRDSVRGGIPQVLVLINSEEKDLSLDHLCEVAHQYGWRAFRFLPFHAGADESQPSDADIDLAGSHAVLRSLGSTRQFVADLVPQDVFAQYCRRFGQDQGAPVRGRSVPAGCTLAEVLDLSAEATALRWSVGRLAPGLAIPLGQGGDGPRILDLEADGPHLLVAGTTGSGKSELLRTLSVALALSYPPDRMNILFFDFKGGAGLGPLTSLPHCVGLMTDLTRSELDRTMASLRAEVQRREQLLAAMEAPDLMAYREAGRPDTPPLPQLVVIIDEFRMLVDDAPESLNELMRIATIGRSLGLHLVMATQRPQGALNADIRANVTTSIALRVQSAHESADIIGTNAAAAIAVQTPGRAFLVRGSEEPEEFQTAVLSVGDTGRVPSGVVVRRTLDALSAGAPRSPEGAAPPLQPTPAAAAAPIVETLNLLWQECGTGPVRSPVAPPLPSTPTYPRPPDGPAPLGLPMEGLSPAAPATLPSPASAADALTGSPAVELGWLDLPQEQKVVPLSWRPLDDGHLAFIGATLGDAASAMSLVLDQLAVHPVESHLYVLDADGSFVRMQSSSRTGAVVGLHDVRRGVRVLERIGSEMSRRLSGTGTLRDAPLVLAISGWGSWLSAMRSGPLMWGEGLVQDIVRDGRRAGITAILSGERDLAVSRFLSDVPNRVYFPRGASDESRFSWPKMPTVPKVPGRAVAFGSIVGGGPAVCQFHASDGQARQVAQPRSTLARPFRVEALPHRLTMEDMLGLIRRHRDARTIEPLQPADPATAPAERIRRLFVGVGGDELSPVALRLPTAAVLAILGAPRSGKTSLLGALPVINSHVPAWLRPGLGRDPDGYWEEIHRDAATGRLCRGAVLLVDDADRLASSTGQKLLEVNTLGWPVILSANYGQSLLQRAPLAMAARNGGTGILIAPRTHMDGDLFGVRFELEPNPPPGRAILLADGRGTPIQLPVPAELRTPAG